jgi:hypothetical protein
MKIITPGHCYELANFEQDLPELNQRLQFIHKEQRPEVDPPVFFTVTDGTTNEEVLKVLIDRLQSLNAKLPNRQTSIAVTKCQEALMWLENRTAERKARGVEGTPKP